MVKIKKVITSIKSWTLKLIYTSSHRTYNKIISSITYVKIGLFTGSRIQRQKKRKIIFYNNLFRNMNNTVVYDLGSSIGNMTEVFLLAGAKRVICFEPQIELYEFAKSRFLYNNKVKLNNYAISNKNQKLKFHIHSTNPGISTLSKKWKNINNTNNKQHYRETTVKARTIDWCLKRNLVPNYIKIDIEGSELKVLEMLKTPIMLISFEANMPHFNNETIKIINSLDNLAEGKCVFKIVDFKRKVNSPWMKTEKLKTLVKSKQIQNSKEIFFKNSNLRFLK